MRANRLVGKPGGAAGKGMSEIQAKASCLAEAMERYLGHYRGREPRLRAAWSAMKDAGPHPYELLNFSDHQYEIRDAWNTTSTSHNLIAEPFDESRAIEWTPAWSLNHGSAALAAARYCYYEYFDPAASADNKFCVANSNGCASGSTIEEAILQGFFELVERDACALWWYNRIRRPAFQLSALDSPFARRVEAIANGRTVACMSSTPPPISAFRPPSPSPTTGPRATASCSASAPISMPRWRSAGRFRRSTRC